jgi:hypothetical protein
MWIEAEEIRWWTLDDLRDAGLIIAPRRLTGPLANPIWHGARAEPSQVDE